MARDPGAGKAADLNAVVGVIQVSNEELRTANRLLAALATRGMQQRQAILLLDALAFQPKQIAQVLDITANSVRVALHKARKAARTQGGADPSDTDVADAGPIDGDD